VDKDVQISLSKQEALVLFDWLARMSESGSLNDLVDCVEEHVLWDIEASLESILSEPLDSNYREILETARKELGTVRNGPGPRPDDSPGIGSIA